MSEFETVVTVNPAAKAKLKMMSEMWVEAGDNEDWNLLKDLHYKMDSLPIGARYWRLRHKGVTIGVCVIGMSRPLLKERHLARPYLKPDIDTQVSNIHRYAIINDGSRMVGRFVIDTLYRSGGIAYRFLNLASRLHGYQFMEISSSMSKYSDFAKRAGFQMIKPMRSLHYDSGLKFMRKWFESHPADQEALMEEFDTFNADLQEVVGLKMREYYMTHSPLEKTGSRRHYAQRVVDNWEPRRVIAKIQGLCFTSPLYGIYPNPDWGKTIGPKLPLLAFDMQGVNQPLLDPALVPGWTALSAQIAERGWDAPIAPV